jgi:hypothetical protein
MNGVAAAPPARWPRHGPAPRWRRCRPGAPVVSEYRQGDSVLATVARLGGRGTGDLRYRWELAAHPHINGTHPGLARAKVAAGGAWLAITKPIKEQT